MTELEYLAHISKLLDVGMCLLILFVLWKIGVELYRFFNTFFRI